MQRREFVSMAVAGGIAASRHVLGANDRIRIGILGTGGRGTYVGAWAAPEPNAQIVAACDVYEPRRLGAVEKFGAQVEPALDFRTVLDRKDVDAVIIGAPDHWHVPMTIAALQAGKDVYCEKPVTHTLEEGDKLIEAVETSQRVFQGGMQQRSWDHYSMAADVVRSGRLGRVNLAQTWWYFRKESDGVPEPVDLAKLDWKMFLGSAPDQPFSRRKFVNWRYFSDFGGGCFTDLMTHWIDVVQWYMKTPWPDTVQASGFLQDKGLQLPDTVTAILQYPGPYTATFDCSLLDYREESGIIFRGTEGLMKLTREGFFVYRAGSYPHGTLSTGDPMMTMYSSFDGTKANVQNWLECIRSRALTNASVRVSVQAARTSHLANKAMQDRRMITVGA